MAQRMAELYQGALRAGATSVAEGWLEAELSVRCLSQRDLARLAGVSERTVSRLRQGQRVSARALRQLVLTLDREPILIGEVARSNSEPTGRR